MKIKDILLKKNFIFSLEVFPPKPNVEIEPILKVISELQILKPDFISVTYGAGGSTTKRTVELAERIQKDFNIPALAHITCIGATKEGITEILDNLKNKGIENVMALRGDIPHNEEKPFKDFRYASELVKFVKTRWDFCIGVAGYPEKHPEAENMQTDLQHLKEKVDAGADFITTQLFLDNKHFFNYQKLVREIGVNVPIIPGIMTAIKVANIEKMASLCKIDIPEKFRKLVEKNKNINSEICEDTIKYTIEQINDLIKNGIKAIHLYTMNKVEQNKRIYFGSEIVNIRKNESIIDSN